jgi:hypothetical protein
MKCRVPVIAASALAATLTLAISPGANASPKAPIRTYTEQGSVNFTGLGGNASFYSRDWGNERVELGPHLAFAANEHSAFRLNGVHTSSSQLDIVGGRIYTRTGNGPWTGKTLTGGQLRTWLQELNPYVALAKFDALPGVRRVAAGHYRVTGSYAKVGSFLSWEYGLTATSFKGTNIKTFTIDLWVDSKGRPVKITGAARSSNTAFSVTETFGNYNKPLVIRVP